MCLHWVKVWRQSDICQLSEPVIGGTVDLWPGSAWSSAFKCQLSILWPIQFNYLQRKSRLWLRLLLIARLKTEPYSADCSSFLLLSSIDFQHSLTRRQPKIMSLQELGFGVRAFLSLSPNSSGMLPASPPPPPPPRHISLACEDVCVMVVVGGALPSPPQRLFDSGPLKVLDLEMSPTAEALSDKELSK